MRKYFILLIALIINIIFSTMNMGKTKMKTSMFQIPEQGEVVIGILIKNQPKGLKNPSEYVLEDGYLYKGADYRINETNAVINNTNLDPAEMVGKVVVAFVKEKIDMTQILKKIGPAPQNYGREESMQQLRSDWMARETGFSVGRSTTERLKKIPYYEVYRIVTYPGLQTLKTRDAVFVGWKNFFNKDMTDLKIIAHYEGGRGKPSPRYTTRNFNEPLKTDKKIAAEFSLQYKPEREEQQSDNDTRRRREIFVFQSIIISGKLGNFPFKFEVYP